MYRTTLALLTIVLLAGGCGSVQRELTIKSEPAGAIVLLNDEEIGTSPVTVAFNWYGDYRVRLSHDGHETLSTHRLLEAPWYDYFPFDLARILIPARTTDKYEWNFELKESVPPTREQLIKAATQMRESQKTSAK
jgi:hypothetical protein